MRHMFVRPLRKEDIPDFTRYSLDTKNNLFDPGVFNYSSTFTRCVFDNRFPVLFAPIQKPLMIDALAFNPITDAIDRARAMQELIQDVVSQAYIQGAGEVYFMVKDPSTAEFAARQTDLFEEMPHRLFRAKLSNLEKHETKTTK